MVTTDVHWNLAYELHSHCCGTLELFFSVTILFIMSGKSPFDKLNETNHNNWKIQMEALLKEKGLFGVTCGCDIMPATGPNLKGIHTFIEKQRLTHAKIILCIEPSQIPHIRNESDPAVIFLKFIVLVVWESCLPCVWIS